MKKVWSIAAALRRDNLQLVGKLVVVAGLMFGFGYALVPLYRAVCTALGINVLSLSERQHAVRAEDAQNTQVDLSRSIEVEFDANARGPWEFKPAVGHLTVHPGELTTVMYEFRNVQNRTCRRRRFPAMRRSRPRPTSTSWNASASTSTPWRRASPSNGRWCSIIDPKLPKEREDDHACPIPSSRWRARAAWGRYRTPTGHCLDSPGAKVYSLKQKHSSLLKWAVACFGA